MDKPRFHRLSIQRTSDGQVAVAVDILGPIVNPLEGLTMREKMWLLIRPYSRSERALMRAVKGLPTVARRAVAADILASRRDQMTRRQQQRAERDAVETWLETTVADGGRVQIAVPSGAVGADRVPKVRQVTGTALSPVSRLGDCEPEAVV